ncbi:soluble liver antigen/liver pancreas antigen-domain-containing protein [Syncephalis pseudoplumigaleata]|uniref:O-phosphoseryl-tRNA(Sec) selenium transferase n=1 Tax=Syncephalis pseudoplumigaleata TaxID=1712513 RepID=A0A4P9YZP8_9FUNG|nr:soluble liver antigen/liver pancreas antigen-domain-containing protein [Syncephalis pseudoplumigaleata]|eukprot:RKP25478.1 soluble liver antigen/liver pancreas antigen-domain-containing protein [Syncephalis pseudoplumigaleata]
MDSSQLHRLAADLLGESANGQVAQAVAARNTRVARMRSLLAQRTLPPTGWSESDIVWLLAELAGMDSNNFEREWPRSRRDAASNPLACGVRTLESAGAGEREGRVLSALVARRHYGFSHGIGRSGDLTEVQPKAAGSSLIQRLTNALTLHALRIAGASKLAARASLVVPVATGMAIALCLTALRELRPHARYVLWPRIDQKSAFKAILTAGLEPVVVANRIDGDQVCTDLARLERTVRDVGPEHIVCILSTTSCFAPRVPDDLGAIGKLCAQFNLPHLVNNAYGVQSRRCMNAVSEAARHMRSKHADASPPPPLLVVQSTDKNFLVGGAIVFSPSTELLSNVAKSYPGRASMTPVLDMFITLLTLGEAGYRALLADRKEVHAYLHEQLSDVAAKLGTRVLSAPRNDISMGGWIWVRPWWLLDSAAKRMRLCKHCRWRPY